MKFDISVFFENLSRKFKFHLNMRRIKGTLHEHQYTFCIISLSLLLRMINVSGKSCRENQNTHFVFNNCLFFIFFFCNRVVYEIMWKNIVEPDGPQMTKRRIRIACWVPKATNTHSEYVILTLHYMDIACLV